MTRSGLIGNPKSNRIDSTAEQESRVVRSDSHNAQKALCYVLENGMYKDVQRPRVVFFCLWSALGLAEGKLISTFRLKNKLKKYAPDQSIFHTDGEEP